MIAGMVPLVIFAQSTIDDLLAQSQQEEMNLAAEIAQLQQEIVMKQAIANNSTIIVYLAPQDVIDKAAKDDNSILKKASGQEGLNVVVGKDLGKGVSREKRFPIDSAYCNGARCYDGATNTGIIPPTKQFQGPIQRFPDGAVVLVFEEQNNGKSTERQILSRAEFNAWLAAKQGKLPVTPLLPQNPLPDPRLDNPPRPPKPRVANPEAKKEVILFTGSINPQTGQSWCGPCNQLKSDTGFQKLCKECGAKTVYIPNPGDPNGVPMNADGTRYKGSIPEGVPKIAIGGKFKNPFDQTTRLEMQRIAAAKKNTIGTTPNATPTAEQELPPIIFHPAPPRTTSVASPGGPSDAEVEAEKQRITEEINRINALIKTLEMSNNPNDQVILDGLRQELKNILSK